MMWVIYTRLPGEICIICMICHIVLADEDVHVYVRSRVRWLMYIGTVVYEI